MLSLILLGIILVGSLCVFAYTLAVYALPFLFGLAAARFAYATGAGTFGAGFVGLVGGVGVFAALKLLFSHLSSPILRFIVMIIFVIPATMAGDELVQAVARQAIPSEIWCQIFGIFGGGFVGIAALLRLRGSSTGIFAKAD